MKKEIIIGFSRGLPVIEEGVLIRTADPAITGRIFEVEGMFFVKDNKEDNVAIKRFSRLNDAINYCQPKNLMWS
jgi:hypothetical protein